VITFTFQIAGLVCAFGCHDGTSNWVDIVNWKL
jgi:hypothetical protein